MKQTGKKSLSSAFTTLALVGAFCWSLSAMPVNAQVTTVDFEDINLGGAAFLNVGSEVSSQGYKLQSEGSIFIIGNPSACGGPGESCADNGTQTLVSLHAEFAGAPGGPITMTEQDNRAFRFQSLDAAVGIVNPTNPNNFPPAQFLRVTGRPVDGSPDIEQTFWDLQDDFQTFFPCSLAGVPLRSIKVEGLRTGDLIMPAQSNSQLELTGTFSLDNVVMEALGQTSQACSRFSFSKPSLRDRRDRTPAQLSDTFLFQGTKNEQVTIAIAGNDSGSYKRGKANILLTGPGLHMEQYVMLPTSITTTLPNTGTYSITVEVSAGRDSFEGDFCVTLTSTVDAMLYGGNCKY